MEQILQVAGAMLVLSAFVLSQLGRLATTSPPYLVLNLVGAGILAVLAAVSWQPGFLLLEGVWALVAGVGLGRALRATRGVGAGTRNELGSGIGVDGTSSSGGPGKSDLVEP